MCNMLYDVESSLKMVKFLLQHFGISQDVASVWLAPSQISSHYSTMLQDIALKCCMRLTGLSHISRPVGAQVCGFGWQINW